METVYLDLLRRAISIGVSIGSVSIIAVVIVFSIRLKRNQMIEIIEPE